MSKIIDAIRKGTPESPAYSDSVAVIEDGIELYNDGFSTEPNPYQPRTKKPWEEVYARVAEGTYTWRLVPKHPKYGRCILVNEGAAVPTLNPNVNHNREYIATQIFIHRGYSGRWRGSRACMTVPPDKLDSFFGLFADNETGKLILRKEGIV
jgi:hypothetical protein